MAGAVAQLGERLNGIQEVVGSIPISSTKIEDKRRSVMIASFFFLKATVRWLVSIIPAAGQPTISFLSQTHPS